MFEELSPPYATIAADPPWGYVIGGPRTANGVGLRIPVPPYSTMTVDGVAAMPVADLADDAAHLYLWTTNRYVRDAYAVAEAWGFTPSQLLTWCKPPHGLGPGGAFANTTEFVLFARRGTLTANARHDSTWFTAPRGAHSAKPGIFGDLVEKVSPGPYLELFARQPRLGWDSWGLGYETATPITDTPTGDNL